MKQSRKFNLVFITFIIIFLVFNFSVWNSRNKILYDPPEGYSSGDLSRLSKEYKLNILKKDENNLPKRHIEFENYKNENIDVLTIGDSFSNAGSGGLNPYYQDYLASLQNYKVLNIKRIKEKSVISTFEIILNNGLLDEIKPKYVLLEIVVRGFAYNNVKSNNEILINKKSFKNIYPKIFVKGNNSYKKNKLFDFISLSNFKCFIDDFDYSKSAKSNFAQVYKVKLNKNLFNNKTSNDLLFYYQDIGNINNNDIDLLNNNLNNIAKELEKRDIKLIFMPAVDKYDLYSDYIIKNKYPKNDFFKILRRKKKNYYLIDTKKILQGYAKKGESDIFYIDDTHWSSKASKLIFENYKIPK